MTTRKLAAPLAVIVLLAGCATPGPLHVYSLSSATAETIADTGPAPANATPSFLSPGETITGFAYDPFTDHFFLRLAPGNRIRVVDRPARKIKREFTVEKIPTTGGGDLAVRPRDGHLFFTVPNDAALIETTRLGEFVQRIELQSPAGGVGFDSQKDQLLVLYGVGRIFGIIDREGIALTHFTFSRPTAPGTLGYDSERHEIYAPLVGGRETGIFDRDGTFLRTLPLAAESLDVGPRSFLRMF